MDSDKQESNVIEFHCSEERGCECDCCCFHRCKHGDLCFGGHTYYPELHWYRCIKCTPSQALTVEEAKRQYRERKARREA